MCIKCVIKRAALEAAGMEEVKEIVGTIGRGFVKELTQLDEAEEKLKAQMSEAMQSSIAAHKEKLEAEMREKFGKKFEDLDKLQQDVLDDALKSAGIEIKDEQEFHLDVTTGEIEVVSIQPKADTAPGVH